MFVRMGVAGGRRVVLGGLNRHQRSAKGAMGVAALVVVCVGVVAWVVAGGSDGAEVVQSWLVRTMGSEESSIDEQLRALGQ